MEDALEDAESELAPAPRWSVCEKKPSASPDKTVVKAYPLEYETTHIRASLE